MGLGDNFWEEWADRFDRETHKFITISDDLVIKEAKKVNIDNSDTRLDRAFKVWVHVHNEIDYVLSKRWKTPRHTLKEGTGDCEDVTFLLASMFPNVGVHNTEMNLGVLNFEDGRKEYHTWNTVEDTTMDATGPPHIVEQLKYVNRVRWKLISAKTSKKVVA